MSPTPDTPPTEPRLEQVIRRSSVMELSLVIAIAGAIVGGTVWATKISVIQEQNTEALTRIRQDDLPRIGALIESKLAQTWSMVDTRLYVDKANAKAEVWRHEMARALGLAPDALPVFALPDPMVVR